MLTDDILYLQMTISDRCSPVVRSDSESVCEPRGPSSVGNRHHDQVIGSITQCRASKALISMPSSERRHQISVLSRYFQLSVAGTTPASFLPLLRFNWMDESSSLIRPANPFAESDIPNYRHRSEELYLRHARHFGSHLATGAPWREDNRLCAYLLSRWLHQSPA